MTSKIAKLLKVAIIGASGACGRGIVARPEEIGVETVGITRSPKQRPKTRYLPHVWRAMKAAGVSK